MPRRAGGKNCNDRKIYFSAIWLIGYPYLSRRLLIESIYKKERNNIKANNLAIIRSDLVSSTFVCIGIVHTHFNFKSNNYNINIQFTIERYHPNGLAYLDTLNKVREDGRIDISVNRKPTHTDRYLQFDSPQPIHHKAAVAKSLYSRTAKVSSNLLNKMSEVEHMNRILESNGYPKEFLKKQRRIVFETNPREDRSKGDDDDNDRKGLIVLPYIRSVTERLKRVLKKHNFVVAEKPVLRLKNILTKIKDKVRLKSKRLLYIQSHVRIVIYSILEKQVVHYKRGDVNINAVLVIIKWNNQLWRNMYNKQDTQ